MLPDIQRTIYAELMDFFIKPGGRIILSFFDYEHTEHPMIPFELQKRKWSLSTESISTPLGLIV